MRHSAVILIKHAVVSKLVVRSHYHIYLIIQSIQKVRIRNFPLGRVTATSKWSTNLPLTDDRERDVYLWRTKSIDYRLCLRFWSLILCWSRHDGARENKKGRFAETLLFLVFRLYKRKLNVFNGNLLHVLAIFLNAGSLQCLIIFVSHPLISRYRKM